MDEKKLKLQTTSIVDLNTLASKSMQWLRIELSTFGLEGNRANHYTKLSQLNRIGKNWYEYITWLYFVCTLRCQCKKHLDIDKIVWNKQDGNM